MELIMARFLNDREGMLDYLAQANIVPVMAVPWAKKCSFALRPKVCSRAMTAKVIKVLCIIDESSCKEVRERIKHIRQSMGYKYQKRGLNMPNPGGTGTK